jgi:hypothetical protein
MRNNYAHVLFAEHNSAHSVTVLGQQLSIKAVHLTHMSSISDNCLQFAIVLHSNVNVAALYGERAVAQALHTLLVAALQSNAYAATADALQSAQLSFAEAGLQQQHSNVIVMDCYNMHVCVALYEDCIHAAYAVTHECVG